MTGSEEAGETPAGIGRLGVDKVHRRTTRVADQCVAGDHAPAVVTDHGDTLEIEKVDDAAHGRDVASNRQVGRVVEDAVTRGRKVDDVTRHMVHQVGKEASARGPTDRPTVDDEHVGTRSDPTVRRLTGSHVETSSCCRRLDVAFDV